MNSDKKELTSEYRDLVTQMKKVRVNVAIVKNVNEKLVSKIMKTEQQCRANVQYLR